MSLAALALALGAFASAATSRPLVVVALGDSTTAGTPAFRSPLEAPPDGRGDPESQYVHWLALARPGWTALNRGVDGERTDEIRARFARDVEAASPRDVIILAGVNDVYQGRPLAEAEADLLWMYRRAKALGIVPIAATVLPFDRATEGQNQRLTELNRWIRTVARSEKIRLCDAARAAADPKDPRRLKDSPDGLHPGVAGYRAVGEACAKELK